MAWIKAGSVDGDGTSTYSSSVFTPSTFTQIMNFTEATTALNDYMRLGSTTIDSGGNYAWRYSQNGAADGTGTSRTEGFSNQSATNDAGEVGLRIWYIINIAGEEKLGIGNIVDNVASGAGTAPNRKESTCKWVNTSNQFDIVGSYTASGTYNANSNLSALGSDGVESLNVQDGAVYYETDTNKEYVLYNNSWTEL